MGSAVRGADLTLSSPGGAVSWEAALTQHRMYWGGAAVALLLAASAEASALDVPVVREQPAVSDVGRVAPGGRVGRWESGAPLRPVARDSADRHRERHVSHAERAPARVGTPLASALVAGARSHRANDSKASFTTAPRLREWNVVTDDRQTPRSHGAIRGGVIGALIGGVAGGWFAVQLSENRPLGYVLRQPQTWQSIAIGAAAGALIGAGVGALLRD